jgi:hypothetical protein
MNELIRISGELEACGASAVSLKIPTGLEASQWKAIGHELHRRRGASMFWIGDWVNYGQAEYGAKYNDAKKVFCDESSAYGGYDENTLRVASSVCARVPDVIRVTSLSFGHHALVAGMPHEEQKMWLARAAKGKWPRALLSLKIREALGDEGAKQINPVASEFTWGGWFGEWERRSAELFERMPLEQWGDDVLNERIAQISEVERPLIEERERRKQLKEAA